MVPGEWLLSEEPVEINAGRRTVTLRVRNTGDRPIQVGSHYHFFEANRALDFDRTRAFGMRLNVPAGNAIRFEPGDEKDVDLVEVGGMKRIFGFDNIVDGSFAAERTVRQAMRRAVERGYRGAREWQAPRGDPGGRQGDSR
ncbi:urease subunit beta [Planosporangium thailandense]|uniref:Urease subunit beta n=1 Tax=Planosporangium thailandense TaxID=765197 RepID=A0ABX0XZU2_9ACTN|nr:urease subunit beta [Planosporangium thailandense]NJC71336.1 urease subunit beta [Planosporangium thailandense]